VYGAPDAPPVLLLHGISNSRDVWYDWAAELSDRYRVFTLDFRGHGHSARTPRYTIDGYVADATAVLEAIGEPVRVVGHSLGGVIAGVLSQQAHPLVHSALLVDPAWYFGIAAEFERTVYPRRFALLTGLVERLRAEQAPLAAWVAAVADTPHPAGGVFADHMPYRQLLSHGSALQRWDVAVLRATMTEVFASLDYAQPFGRPTHVIHCDDALGAALLQRHADQLTALNPGLSVTHYSGSDHFPLRTTAFAPRFRRDLEGFLRG
jgi:pimeloyl-ACP methyl ester carboxylesterase